MSMPSNNSLLENLTGKLLQAYNDNIADGESVDVRLQPAVGTALIVTDRRVVIIKAGLATAGGLLGASIKSFPFDHITSVDLRVSFFGGHLQVTVAGSGEVQDNRFMDMARSENAVTFQAKHKDLMRLIANMIRERADAARTRTAQVPTQVPSTNVAEQILQLAELVKQGMLSNEEFELAKQKLLR